MPAELAWYPAVMRGIRTVSAYVVCYSGVIRQMGSMSAYMCRRLWWHLAVVGKAGAMSRDTNMSMRRRWGWGVV